MSVWDNQQATSWFNGILEGEGHFRLRDDFQKEVSIPNTDRAIIRECQKFLVTHRISHNTCEWTKKTAGNKTMQVISLQGDACDSLYQLVGSSLECRLDEFQWILGASETARETTVDLHWLIGIWEAEGGFHLYWSRGRLEPRVQMTNANLLVIGKALKTLDSIGCEAWSGNYKKSVNRVCVKISLQGVYRVRKFLIQTQGLWRSERNVERSSLLLEFINIELAKLMRAPCSARQLKILERIEQLNS